MTTQLRYITELVNPGDVQLKILNDATKNVFVQLCQYLQPLTVMSRGGFIL